MPYLPIPLPLKNPPPTPAQSASNPQSAPVGSNSRFCKIPLPLKNPPPTPAQSASNPQSAPVGSNSRFCKQGCQLPNLQKSYQPLLLPAPEKHAKPPGCLTSLSPHRPKPSTNPRRNSFQPPICTSRCQLSILQTELPTPDFTRKLPTLLATSSRKTTPPDGTPSHPQSCCTILPNHRSPVITFPPPKLLHNSPKP
ncbi:hypothetical protein QE152_g5355 [Popillia japonica]|uniref:Uncharacterized protein n=1 Tax=Popillia japonica TaxID=7064 RepID=A0AAW1MNU1_POPJA